MYTVFSPATLAVPQAVPVCELYLSAAAGTGVFQAMAVG